MKHQSTTDHQYCSIAVVPLVPVLVPPRATTTALALVPLTHSNDGYHDCSTTGNRWLLVVFNTGFNAGVPLLVYHQSTTEHHYCFKLRVGAVVDPSGCPMVGGSDFV